MSLFDSINETNRAYCLHHVKRSMFLYKSMNYTVRNDLYRFFYGSYGFLWILFTILTGVVHSGLACMTYISFAGEASTGVGQVRIDACWLFERLVCISCIYFFCFLKVYRYCTIENKTNV